MKKHTMFLVLAIAIAFVCASAYAQHTAGGQQGSMGGQPGTQNPNNPNNPNYPNNPNNPNNQVDMGSNQQTQQSPANIPKVSDGDLQNAVRSKLATDPAFANVQSTVDNGKVTLDGTVNSKDDKKKAKDAVKSIAGVRGVKEHLTVSGNPTQNAPKPSSASGPGGMALLSAQDAAQGNASQNTAGSIAGNSQTSANPTSSAPQAMTPEAGGMSQSGASPAGGTNTVLQKQIQSSINNDASMSGSSVSVNVSQTAVDLNGTVGSSKAKLDAEHIAQAYAQNRRVNNNLLVRGAGNGERNNGRSAVSSETPAIPKGDSPQMPQTTPQVQGEQTTPQTTTPH